MDDDKLFEMMTKMYSEIQQGFGRVDARLDTMDIRMDNIENRMERSGQSVVRLEETLTGKIDSLFDGFQSHAESINEIDRKLDILTNRVEHQEIRLQESTP